MGNAESRALAAVCYSIDHEAVLTQHALFLDTEDRDHRIDRAAFGLLFRVEGGADTVPYKLIDQLFDATVAARKQAEGSLHEVTPTDAALNTADAILTADPNDWVHYKDLLVSLVLATPQLSLAQKVQMLFQGADPTAGKEKELAVDTLAEGLSSLVVSAVKRLRGREIREGIFAYENRRCAGCSGIPRNAAYECVQCWNGATAMGIPVTVHLCGNCVGSWTGVGFTQTMKHLESHEVVQVRRAPNPHVATHVGTACSGCGQCPIAGPRYQCNECIDMVDLCNDCYQTSEAPFGHSAVHPFTTHYQPLSVDEEVQRLIHALLVDCGLLSSEKDRSIRALETRQNTSQVKAMSHDEAAAVVARTMSPLAIADCGYGADAPIAPHPEKDHRYVNEQEFVAAAASSERMTALMSGFNIRHVALSGDIETVEVERTVTESVS